MEQNQYPSNLKDNKETTDNKSLEDLSPSSSEINTTSQKGEKSIPIWLQIILILLGAIVIIVLLAPLLDSIFFFVVFVICGLAFIPELLKEKR